MTRRRKTKPKKEVTPEQAQAWVMTQAIVKQFTDQQASPAFALTVSVNVLREVMTIVTEMGPLGADMVKTVAGAIRRDTDKLVLAHNTMRVLEVLNNPKVFQP